MEGDAAPHASCAPRAISIHALRVEGDDISVFIRICAAHNFYPRPPGGGRLVFTGTLEHKTNFYPRPPGGGRHEPLRAREARRCISIHALRVEGDPHAALRRFRCSDFYPRPPGGGRPPMQPVIFYGQRYFYPRPPGGGRLFREYPTTSAKLISIHALRVEGDCVFPAPIEKSLDFYPRPPGGGRRREVYTRYLYTGFLSTPSGWRATCANFKRSLTK